MKHAFTIAAYLLLTACILSAHANTVYKKVNKDGSVQYSDKPFPGAIEHKLKDMDSQSKLPALLPPSTFKGQKSQNKIKTSITIVSPQHGATIRDNQGSFTILVQKQGDKKKNYKTQILVNGSPVGEPTQASVIPLKNIDRGEIKVIAQLLSSSGKILATSEETVVYLHRASVIRSR